MRERALLLKEKDGNMMISKEKKIDLQEDKDDC